MLRPAVVYVALVVAVVGSLGAPLITAVATEFGVSLASAQWTLTGPLLAGAVATPVMGRLGTGRARRPTVLVTLGVVVAGGLLTVLPLGFGWLLVGRAAQGLGLGLTALMMGVARDHLPPSRAGSTIALISVSSTAGLGIGYPVAGLLTDVGGVRAAYALGLAITAVALVIAGIGIPDAPGGRSSRVDILGGVLLGAGLLAVLLAVSDSTLWRANAAAGVGAAVGGFVLLVVWAVYQRRTPAPLVDLGLLRNRIVATANLCMFVGGIGMYLLLTLIARYVQTPRAAGYGFDASTLVAGLTLVPFSLAGFLAGRLIGQRKDRSRPVTLLVASTSTVLLACVAFAIDRELFIEPLIAMAVLGLGVGGVSATMPTLVLTATPSSETSSAMSVNQVIRAVGFSLGSAIAGLILSAATPNGHAFPTNSGYTVAAWIAAAAMALTTLISLRIRTTPSPAARR